MILPWRMKKNSAPADLVVDGDESSVSDFLIGYLNEYIQSEGYLDRKANYEAITGDQSRLQLGSQW